MVQKIGRRHVRGCTFVLVAVFLATSCGSGKFGSTGAGRAAGQLSANPSSINFGNVAVGSGQNQTGTLTASGSNVTVSSASWNGQQYSLSGITFPAVVAAGNSISFIVNFAPQTSGSSSGQISFFSDGSNSPTVTTVSGTGVQTSPYSVSLTWNASSSSSVMGYNIYRSTQSGGPYIKLNSLLLTTLAYTDSSVQSGLTYSYAATAVDSNNVESAYSNLATAVIP